MNYEFSQQARAILRRSEAEALALKHDYVGTEHILLSLLAEETGAAVAVFERLDVSRELVRELVLSSVRAGKGEVSEGRLPYTARSKKALELAMTAARDLNSKGVGAEHLLLGLIRVPKGIASLVLAHFGITDDVVEPLLKGGPTDIEASFKEVQAARLRMRFRRKHGPRLSLLLGDLTEKAESRPRFQFRVDDSSDRSIYEQIIAQVQEAVATGVLQPGDRLPAVRQLADELDIAPGTVARAYSELERLGVVVTEGARGTRIAEQKKKRVRDEDRPETLVGLLRPVAVAAFHLGASSAELRTALEGAMQGIYE